MFPFISFAVFLLGKIIKTSRQIITRKSARYIKPNIRNIMFIISELLLINIVENVERPNIIPTAVNRDVALVSKFDIVLRNPISISIIRLSFVIHPIINPVVEFRIN